MSEQTLHIIAGCPKDEHAQRLLGITSHTPPPGSSEDKCDLCDCVVWIGPKQAEHVRGHPDTPVVCLMCGALINSQADNFTVEHLGGQSSKVEFDLSRVRHNKN
jgi:hypothetical protein